MYHPVDNPWNPGMNLNQNQSRGKMVDKAGIAGMNLSMGMSKGKCVVQKKSAF